MKIPAFNEIIEPNDQTQARQQHLKELAELVGNPDHSLARTPDSMKQDFAVREMAAVRMQAFLYKEGDAYAVLTEHDAAGVEQIQVCAGQRRAQGTIDM